MHALGRLLQPADEWEVDRIAKTLLDQEASFQDLVRGGFWDPPRF